MREALQTDDGRCPGVVLLHGIARSSASLKRLEQALRASGFATLKIDYASRSKPIAALADDIHPAIARFAERETPLHFVSHSMGGLVARAYIASTGRHGSPPSAIEQTIAFLREGHFRSGLVT